MGVPSYDNETGSVFVSAGAAESLSGTFDLTADSGGEAFVRLNGNGAGDRFGAFVAGGDINGNGREKILVAAPGAGAQRASGASRVPALRAGAEADGIVYIFDDAMDLVGTIYGTETYPLRSMTLGRYLNSETTDIMFGPENRALNPNLIWDNETGTVDLQTSGNVLLVTGDVSQDKIGADLLMKNIDSSPAEKIYTVRGASDVCKLEVPATALPKQGGGGGGSGGGISLNGDSVTGCRLQKENVPSRWAIYLFMWIFSAWVLSLLSQKIRLPKK